MGGFYVIRNYWTFGCNIGGIMPQTKSQDEKKLNELAAPDGSVDFNDQQATNFIIENRTNDTGMTVTGQIWFRTDV